MESLESLLNKATNPLDENVDDACISRFCDQIKTDVEGPKKSVEYLLHKIKSPQEKEALKALAVIEVCVKNCGEFFHRRLGKPAVMDELFKLISKKTMDDHTCQSVKNKLITLLYIWSVELPEEAYINQTYKKIISEGIITADPMVDPSCFKKKQSDSKKSSLFSNKESNETLYKLLQSKNPIDVQTANYMIQQAVQADEIKLGKQAKRSETLEEAKTSVQLLKEMIDHCNSHNNASQENEIMKDLYDSCHRLRPLLYKTASEVAADDDEDDKLIPVILRVNDDVSRVMESYEILFSGESASTGEKNFPDSSGNKSVGESTSSLLDLNGLTLIQLREDDNSESSVGTFPIEDVFNSSVSTERKTNSVKENTLLDFDPSSTTVSNNFESFLDDDDVTPIPSTTDLTSLATTSHSTLTLLAPVENQSSKQLLHDFDLIDFDPLKHSEKDKKSQMTSELDMFGIQSLNERVNPSLIDFAGDKTEKPLSPTLIQSFKPVQPAKNLNLIPPPVSLDNVFVHIQTIRPSTLPPLTIYDKNSIRVLLHFAKDHVSPSRTDTLVCVISIISTRSEPVCDIRFQVAALKEMKVKLQPASCLNLPAYNPISANPPLTQVMIIANPTKKDVELRYKLNYKLISNDVINESGRITGFPDPFRWGRL